jgi:hypothetical protein
VEPHERVLELLLSRLPRAGQPFPQAEREAYIAEVKALLEELFPDENEQQKSAPPSHEREEGQSSPR